MKVAIAIKTMLATEQKLILLIPDQLRVQVVAKQILLRQLQLLLSSALRSQSIVSLPRVFKKNTIVLKFF